MSNRNILAGGGVFASSRYRAPEDSNITSSPLIHDQGGAGIHMMGETGIFGPFTLIGNLLIQSSTVRADYYYINPNKITEIGNQAQLSGDLIAYNFCLGINIYFLSAGILKLYAGGGGLAGLLQIDWNQQEYKDRNGSSTVGLIQNLDGTFNEEGKSAGWYANAGVLFIGKENGVRFNLAKYQLKTSRFQSLNRQNFSIENYSLSILYNRIVF